MEAYQADSRSDSQGFFTILIATTFGGFVFYHWLAGGGLRVPRHSRLNACIANLKQLESAKIQWALDNKKPQGSPVAVNDLVGATLYMKRQPICPSSGTYFLGRVGIQPSCSQDRHRLPAPRKGS